MLVKLLFRVFLYLVYSQTQSISAQKVSRLSRREIAGIRLIGVKTNYKQLGAVGICPTSQKSELTGGK